MLMGYATACKPTTLTMKPKLVMPVFWDAQTVITEKLA